MAVLVKARRELCGAPTHGGGQVLTAPPPSAKLSIFQINFSQSPWRVRTLHANPLCRLAAACGAANGHCGRGCGIVDPAREEKHVCPFGLAMRRVKRIDSGTVEWTGRRFESLEQLHGALNALADAGYDEETILASLPANPVLREDELAAAAGLMETTARGAAGEAPPARHPLEPGIGDMLEFFSQIQTLLGTAKSISAASDCFLRALSALVPYEHAEIHLADEHADGGLVIAAIIETRNGKIERIEKQSGRPDGGALGSEAFRRGVAMAWEDGQTDAPRPLTSLERGLPAALALPLAEANGKTRGVWLMNSASPQARIPLRNEEWLRCMGFLARVLAGEIARKGAQRPEEPKEDARPQNSREEVPRGAEIKDAQSECRAALTREVARAARQGGALTAICLTLGNKRRGAENSETETISQCAAEIAQEIKTALRPYDEVTTLATPSGARECRWMAILPGVDENVARGLACRLLTALEDALDARGGMEELGLRAAAGIAAWGPQTADAPALESAARNAASQAAKRHAPSAVMAYGAEEELTRARAASG